MAVRFMKYGVTENDSSVVSHNLLIDKELPDQHPMSSINNLNPTLNLFTREIDLPVEFDGQTTFTIVLPEFSDFNLYVNDVPQVKDVDYTVTAIVGEITEYIIEWTSGDFQIEVTDSIVVKINQIFTY